MFREVIIIPNPDKLNVPPYTMSSNTKNHDELMKPFCDCYNIPYEGTLIYLDLIDIGCIVITGLKDELIIHFPSSISLYQYTKLEEYTKLFSKYKTLDIGIYKNNTHLHQEYSLNDPSSISNFLQTITDNCLESRGLK